MRDDRLLNVLRETERRLAEATAEIDRLHDKLAEALKMERVEYDEALRAEPATNTPSFNATLTPTTEPTPSFDGTLAPGFGEEPAKDAADYTWSEAKFTPIDLPDPLD